MDGRGLPQQPLMSTFLSLCPLCDKAFTQENGYNRHISYCRRAQMKRKGRPKSCIACNTSKTKCTFSRPQCARCETKGFECIYEYPGLLGVSLASDHRQQNTLGPNTDISTTNRQDCNWFASFPSHSVLEPDDFQLGFDSIHNGLNSVGLDSFGEFIGNVVERLSSPEPSSAPLQPGNFTMDQEVLFPTKTSTVAHEIIARPAATRALTHLRQGDLASHHAANLISHIVSAFPVMMLRRHTFPPFIHPHWHRPAVPEKLASCMSIAQLFVSRTPQSRPFLWRTIEAEQQHFRDERDSFSAPEIQQAIQATTIYIIMAIIDQDDDTPVRGGRLMQTFLDLKLHLQGLVGGELIISDTEATNPSSTWEEWIFAELRRRLGCLWFAITRVFALKTNRAGCSGLDDFLRLPLMSAKTAWEARNLEEWQVETSLYGICYPIATFGELVEARRQLGDPVNAQKLDIWEAGVDKLGMMMNIAVELAKEG